MAQPHRLIGTAAKEVSRFAVSWLLGIAGGGLCGAAMAFVFGTLEGFSMGERAETVDVGLFYGAALGTIYAPFAYCWFIRKIGLRRAFWPALIATLTGGFAGMYVNVFLMIPLAILSCFGALAWTAEKHSSPRLTAR